VPGKFWGENEDVDILLPVLGQGPFCVLMYFRRICSGKEGFLDPLKTTREAIAKGAASSPRTVYADLKELEDFGEISAQKETGKRTVYRLLPRQPLPGFCDKTQAKSTGVDTKTQATIAGEGGNHCRGNVQFLPGSYINRDKDSRTKSRTVDNSREKTALIPLTESVDENVSKTATPSEAKKPPEKNGSRLPEDWELPPSWEDWARCEHPNIDPSFEAQKFKDYWIGKAGAQARKLDWLATWRNWIRSAKPTVNSPPARSKHKNGFTGGSLLQTAYDIDERIRRRAQEESG